MFSHACPTDSVLISSRKSSMKPAFHSALLCLLILSSSAHADHWGHWRGPLGNGVAVKAHPPTEWSDSKNVKWKVELPGRGSGSPVVWDNQIFITTAVPTGNGSRQLPELDFQLLSFDRQSGQLQWKRSCIVATPHQGTHSTNGFASASPCTDGTRVYAHFGSRGLYCFSMDGTPVWQRTDFGAMDTRNGFGEGSSPTLAGDMIIVPWDHEGPSALFALNKATGETIWKTDRDEPTCWATPLVIEHDGKQQVIMNGQTCARAYDLKTGKELWRCGGQTERPCASPVAGDGLVFIGSGHRGSFLGAFTPDGHGDIQGSPSVVWTIDKDTPDIGSPLLSAGRLYFHKGKSGQLSCVNAQTGKPFYMASRIPGLDNIYASPIAAGGYVYLTSRNGTTTVIKDAEQLEVVATNNVGETVDATPAPVDNQLIIRGEQHLFCIEQSK
ncbi:MAG: PQQ-like beta-propeller repeat protein [Planctomycetaceae bacterium]|nr:PQQ-like beta-propeller repeat protein [Planctomycetaceae bacterium]